MAKRVVEEEEYEFSVNSIGAIEFHWPERASPADHNWEVDQINLSIELIQGHYRTIMNPAQKRTADRTLRYLRRKLKGETEHCW